MNAREKLNGFWAALAILVGIVVASSFGGVLLFVIVAGAIITWAGGNRHIR